MKTSCHTPGKPFVTFLMPAYNAAAFIGEAIASIQAQTITDWKLIVVDDLSTDDTLAIARRIAAGDSRITVIARDRNSGCAQVPRMQALMAADTEYVSSLDADDWLLPDSLARLVADRDRHDADLIWPTFWRAESRNDRVRRFVPPDDSFYRHAYVGKDAVQFTLDGWRIAACGGLVRKEVYHEAFRRFTLLNDSIYNDEVLTRHLLFCARRVAFSPSVYCYRYNPVSITGGTGLRKLDFAANDIALFDFIYDNYPAGSTERDRMQMQLFHTYMNGCEILARHQDDSEGFAHGAAILARLKSKLDPAAMRRMVSLHYRLMLKLPPQWAGRLASMIHSLK